MGEQGINRVPLCLPFISERVTAAIKQCLVQAQLEKDVILINIPRANLKRQLVRNRLYDSACITRDCVVCPYGRAGECAKCGVVYQIECMSCSVYIGETGRPLSVRISEHLASKKRQSIVSPLGRHRNVEQRWRLQHQMQNSSLRRSNRCPKGFRSILHTCPWPKNERQEWKAFYHKWSIAISCAMRTMRLSPLLKPSHSDPTAHSTSYSSTSWSSIRCCHGDTLGG